MVSSHHHGNRFSFPHYCHGLRIYELISTYMSEKTLSFLQNGVWPVRQGCTMLPRPVWKIEPVRKIELRIGTEPCYIVLHSAIK